jgi:hypothetical protein
MRVCTVHVCLCVFVCGQTFRDRLTLDASSKKFIKLFGASRDAMDRLAMFSVLTCSDESKESIDLRCKEDMTSLGGLWMPLL